MTDLPVWPAAERNKQPILDVLQRVLPVQGLVLEIASATGQHAEHFARSLPQLTWQVSDYDPEHCTTLAERVRTANLSNLLPPVQLDVTWEQWPVTRAAAVFNANMIHISPWPVTLALFAGAARILDTGRLLLTYGPYSVDGQHISESNLRFDESLKSKNPEWGVRDVTQVAQVAQQNGFTLQERILMPANNFTLIWQRQ